MREIRTSGLTSGDGKRGVAAWPKPPRPSSTLPVKGRKRHAVVDTLGLMLGCAILPGNVQDRDGCLGVLRQVRLLLSLSGAGDRGRGVSGPGDGPGGAPGG